MMQLDILIKVPTEEGQREDEKKRVTCQVAEENPVGDSACGWKIPQLPKLITCSINSGCERQVMPLCKSSPRQPTAAKLVGRSGERM